MDAIILYVWVLRVIPCILSWDYNPKVNLIYNKLLDGEG